MYDVTIKNGNFERTIHDHRGASNAQKLPDGSIVDAVNSISSFSFSIYPNNAGYNELNARTTQVRVRNTKRNRDDFVGRVLQVNPSMDSDGMFMKEVICEDRLGYLHDSIQPYAPVQHYEDDAEGDNPLTGIEKFVDVLLANHNAQVEEHKRIYRGLITVHPFESSDGVTKGLNWETTYNAIQEKLLKSFGGFIVLRETAGVLYLDYLEEVGATRSTKIKLGRNMRSISKEIDPSGIITRLVPLGKKLTTLDESGNEVDSEERLTIASVNDGLDYIVSTEYEKQFGIRYGTVTFDDVTEPSNLLTKGTDWLIANNGLYTSHDVDALDLSQIGLDIDDFVLYDRYPVENQGVGVDDILQIVKKTTNIIEPHQSSFEMGDTVKLLSDTMLDYTNGLEDVKNEIPNQIQSEVEKHTTTIYTYVNESISNFKLDPNQIWASIEDRAAAKSDYESFSEIVRNILKMEADGTTMIFQTINEAIKEVGETESTHHAELLTYIRFNENGIEIGKEGNAITMQLDNDSLTFYNNGTPVAYVSDNQLYITDGRFMRSVRIGNYGFIPEANGSVSFTYLGGET